MAGDGQAPFSLRPWPIADKQPKNIADFIARVNAAPDGFRNLDEAALRQQLHAQQQRGPDTFDTDDDADDGDEAEEGQGEADADKAKTVAVARDEFLRNIEFAHQSAMLALDTVSLLLSKEAPVQAGTTLSPALRTTVGIGTLGASRLREPNVTDAQKKDDLAVATGWKLMGVNTMVDGILAAAQRLEREMELETKYWADVLAVSDHGWSVCSLPHDTHTLAVRFGFAESAPAFRDSSIAPLLRDNDGTATLALGNVGGGAQRVRITVTQRGEVTDQSPLPPKLPNDAPLSDRVREARDTIFHQELWYELNREARILLASGIRYSGAAITWDLDDNTQYVFTLEDLVDDEVSPYANLAAATNSCLASYSLIQFLLFQNHRQNYNRRTSPILLTRQSPTMNAPYHILRPFISRLGYLKDAAALTSFLERLVMTIRRAGISTASYSSTFMPQIPSASKATPVRLTPNGELQWVHQLFHALTTLSTLTITPEARIWCHSRAVMQPFIGTLYSMFLRSPFSDNKDLPRNPLEHLCPPSDPHNQPYPNLHEATLYLRQAAVRAISYQCARNATEKLGNKEIRPLDAVEGTGVTDNKGNYARIDINMVDGKAILTLDAQGPTRNETEPRRWTWGPDPEDANAESIQKLVTEIMRGSV
ncbi:subunit 17 of mediator complex-domain-containing protein [Xylariaceae sp. FL1019]|nr:subunit 17 of mediator complex-domain-containing protein [Xylariaceae sp. FL1019]